MTLPKNDDSEVTDKEVIHYFYALEALQREKIPPCDIEKLMQAKDKIKQSPNLI